MSEGTNIYAYARERIMDEQGERITGNPSGVVLAVFTEPPGDAARNALDKSFQRLEFGAGACTFADLSGLAAGDVFDIVEGMDPLLLVATDEAAASSCADALRTPFPLERQARVSGREARAFRNLNAMFGTERDRQLVWHLLKSMA